MPLPGKTPTVNGVYSLIFFHQDPQIEDATQTVSKAFVEYNTSINAHPEMIAGDFGDARTASMVISWSVSGWK